MKEIYVACFFVVLLIQITHISEKKKSSHPFDYGYFNHQIWEWLESKISSHFASPMGRFLDILSISRCPVVKAWIPDVWCVTSYCQASIAIMALPLSAALGFNFLFCVLMILCSCHLILRCFSAVAAICASEHRHENMSHLPHWPCACTVFPLFLNVFFFFFTNHANIDSWWAHRFRDSPYFADSAWGMGAAGYCWIFVNHWRWFPFFLYCLCICSQRKNLCNMGFVKLVCFPV